MAYKPNLVVIGNGMAGAKCVDEIVTLSPGGFRITIFGSEPHPVYNRIQLSKMLQSGTSLEDITLYDRQWYADRGIRLLTGETIVRIDPFRQTVVSASGLIQSYDKLIIATGSLPYRPQLPGIDKSGVTAFRNIEDCRGMIEASRHMRKAAVIGGGLLGLEAARGLLDLGMEVEVVHNAPYLMNRQLDRTAADMLKRRLTEQGMRFRLEKLTEKITGRKRADGLLFHDGTKLSAELIVLAIGISPNAALAKAAGIPVNRAIVVDDYMQTGVNGVYAVGECAEHRGIAYGLVAPLYEQGKVLARTICGFPTEPYEGTIPSAQLKVSGVEVFSAGIVRDGEAETAQMAYDGLKGTYSKLTMIDGKIAGAVLYGDSSDGPRLLGYLKRQADVSVLNERSSSPAGGGAAAAVAALAGGENVCACNGVTKDAILEAVVGKGLRTVEEVRAHTKATGSCGGCKPLVAALLASPKAVQDESRVERRAAPVSLCGCTGLDAAAVKEAAGGGRFANAAAAMAALEWAQPAGCGICRPALDFYTRCEEANSQYATVLIGPSGNSGKALSRDSFGVGIEVERRLVQLRMPAPVKVSISAGPLYPAYTLVQDFALAGAPAGWEIYAGGHAENPVKQGRLLGIAETDEGATEWLLACLQWYREDALYGERAWRWAERVGVGNIRERLADPDFREERLERWRQDWSPRPASERWERTGS